ncbi:hypothetical protein GAY31_09060 [Azospirillum brasilense]|nr:hypothetical protein [Azospirillum brasilense]
MRKAPGPRRTENAVKKRQSERRNRAKQTGVGKRRWPTSRTRTCRIPQPPRTARARAPASRIPTIW